MIPTRLLLFPPFRLDPVNERLWRETQEIPLRPKTFAVLRYLVGHPEQLVTKEELLSAVWPETYVSDVVPMGCIRDLRKILGDDAKEPRFIQTVHRRGYRFIAPLTAAPPVQSSRFKVPSFKTDPAPNTQHPTPNLVGREAELSQLHRWLDKALEGERQIVFVTGEPGIGKTTLMEAFLADVGAHCDAPGARGEAWLGRGQCIEHHGAGEAYMPVLEALGRLCREPEGERLIELLGQYAPTWLVQMPALLSSADLEALQHKVMGATRERMLREMAEAVEALTAERPLVLRLEDLHWSDVSTLDLLSVLARRQEQARLLVIGTYRPVEMLGQEHPLRMMTQELQMHRQCEELPLGLLSEAAVAEYLAMRFRAAPSPLAGEGRGEKKTVPSVASLRELARVIHQRTDGNPLFMVNVVDYLLARGLLVKGEGRWELKGEIKDVEGGVPKSIRQMIEKQIERLSSADRRLLEVASVAGAEFSAAAVAAGLETTVGAVEEQCAELTRREQFLQARGTEEWPDGIVAARYGFIHALYQNVLYERVTVGQRINLHRRIAEREEQAYGSRAREIAAELAMHFERGRDYLRAIRYLQQVAENATRRSAHVEAITHLTAALELLKTLPDTPERTQQELTLQIALGVPLMATKGQAAPEVGRAYTRARELCQQVRETPQLFPVLRGLWAFYMQRAEHQTAHELGQQLLRLAQRAQDPALLLESHRALGSNLFWLGEFALARAHLEQSLAFYNSQPHHSQGFLYGFDPRVACFSYGSWLLWLLGYPDQALQQSQAALTLAQELSHPLSLAYARTFAAEFHRFRRQVQATREHAEAVITLSREQGFSLFLAEGAMLQGWALAEQGRGEEGVTQIRQVLTAQQAAGSKMGGPADLAILAEAYGKVGRAEEGLAVLAEALATADKTGECLWEAEMYRLKGELTLQQFNVQGSKFKTEDSLGSSVQRKQKAKGKGQKSKIPDTQHPTPSTYAEACFLKAIEVARKQQAKSWELRAVMSLSRLWQRQSKKSEAHRMLSNIYGWFTEGFDTKDLLEAKALLEELGS